ncbi:hypothetical protein K438DRAFT_1771356 [Mycena galopus ATCC 62051]|nr:hypothetical protein K438DRAFT_1771356 [Mycena galopus ATCC 62051]
MEFFWENGGQQQQRPPPHVSQVAPGDFRFPESILSESPSEPPVSGYSNPAPLPPDLFPSASTSHAASATFSHQFKALTSWDDEPCSWLPQSAQQHSQIPARWDDASGQPHWDDFASSASVLLYNRFERERIFQQWLWVELSILCIALHPDCGEQLTGHEWVERNPAEFAEHYPKYHKRYLEYLTFQQSS